MCVYLQFRDVSQFADVVFLDQNCGHHDIADTNSLITFPGSLHLTVQDSVMYCNITCCTIAIAAFEFGIVVRACYINCLRTDSAVHIYVLQAQDG